MRRVTVIVNADDLGATPAVNAGIRRGAERGVITSATLMLTMPCWREAVDSVIRPLGLPVGLHLTLTDGRCLSAPEDIPLLVDERGVFRRSAEYLFQRLGFLPGGDALERQVRRELEAQLRAMADLGVAFTHLDSHQHIHMIPRIFGMLRELGPRYGLTRCRRVREPLFAAWPRDRSFPALRRKNWLKWAVIKTLAPGDFRPFAAPAAYMGLLSSGCPSHRCMARYLRAARPGDTVEIGVHPGLADDPPSACRDMSARSFAFSNAPERREELDLLCHERFAALVREAGGRLGSFAALS